MGKPNVGISGALVTPRSDFMYGTKLEALLIEYYSSGVNDIGVTFPDFLKLDTVQSASLLRTAKALIVPKKQEEAKAYNTLMDSVNQSRHGKLTPKR